MQLRTLTIKDFRSITDGYKLPLKHSTVLIGPNNEGKSNVLRALSIATRVLRGRNVRLPTGRSFKLRTLETEQTGYLWSRDYPVHLQSKKPTGESIFVLEFALNDAETQQFRAAVGSKLNGELPIRIALGASGGSVTVPKKGPGGAALSKKVNQIADFVSERLDFQYVPTVRTAAAAQSVVEDVLSRELRVLELQPQYKSALDQLEALYAPVLGKLSEDLHATLVRFLPDIESVEVRLAAERRREALRRACEIIVNDGTRTDLRQKGDGVQSIAALAIMRHFARTGSTGATHETGTILAIEEPESHLHPSSVHEIRSVISEIAQASQVILTTHSPLFVNRNQISSNILVHRRKARPASSVDEIREVLGVRAADNLRHAGVILVVEGEDDRIAMQGVLADQSPILATALANNTLAIDTLVGASNLAYKLGQLRYTLCQFFCLLDDDDAGRKAFKKAEEESLVAVSDVVFTRVRGRSEAEIEDLYREDLVHDVLKASFGINTPTVPASHKRAKWSDRMAAVFEMAGKPWDSSVCTQLKLAVSKSVASKPQAAIHFAHASIIASLVASLEERVATR